MSIITDDKSDLHIFIPSLGAGGAENVIVGLANYLANNSQLNVILVVLDGSGPLKNKLCSKVTLRDLRSSSLAGSLPILLFYFFKFRPKYILSTIKEMNLYCLISNILTLNFGRLIIREANTLSAEFRVERKYTQRVKNYLIRYFYRFANRIVVLSENMKYDTLDVLGGNVADKITVIKNPVNLSWVTSLSDSALPEGYAGNYLFNLNLVCVARFFPSKRHMLLLEVVKELVFEGVDVSLTLVGEGDKTLKESLQAYAQAHSLEDRVFFVGYQSNPYTFIKNADAFLLLSDYEGMPNSLLEAIALKKKVLCRDVPGAGPDIIRSSGAGVVSNSESASSIAKDVMELVAKQIDDEKVYGYISKNHASDVVYEKYLNIMEIS